MAFMPWPLRPPSSHLAFPSRAFRPEPRVPRASCPTPRRRGAGLVALLSVAAPRATARQPKFPEAVEVEEAWEKYGRNSWTFLFLFSGCFNVVGFVQSPPCVFLILTPP